MTFSIQVEKPKLLDMLEAIGVISEEATFDVDKEAWRFRSMDQSHICLIDINHPLNMFQEADVQDRTRFGIKISEAVKVVKRFDDKDVLTVTAANEDAFSIIKTKEKEYRLRMYESTVSEQQLPKLTHDVKLETTWAVLDEAVKDIGVVSDFVSIEAKAGRAFFKGKGDAGEVVRPLVEGWEVNKGEAKSVFSLEYITRAVTAVKHAEGVKLEYSDAKPLKLSFVGRYIAYFLAPRVKD